MSTILQLHPLACRRQIAVLLYIFLLCLPSEEVGTCWFTCVRSVCVCISQSFHFWPGLSIVQAVKHETLPNAGLLLAHRLRGWLNISPVLGYCVVFGATLNVGQRHRWRANINQALVQSIVLVLTRAEWIMPSTGDAGSTFNRHWMVSDCTVWTHHRQQKALSRVFTQCCFNVGPPSSPLAQHWNSIGWITCVCWVLTINL